MSRLSDTFSSNLSLKRASLVTFITAGDPDPSTSYEILRALPAAGSDVIELGMPFSDPMADGAAIQLSSMRALKAGMTLADTLAMVRKFRQENNKTPIVLMGYYNPIYIYGVDRFVSQAYEAGVDGLIIVDLPPEEDAELCIPATDKGLSFIRLVTPTTDAARLPKVLKHASGFIYYVSITGITGTATPDFSKVAQAILNLKQETTLPVAVGFGVKTAEHAQMMAKSADGVVVGSAIVETIRTSLDAENKATSQTVSSVVKLVHSLSSAVRSVQK